MNSTSPFQKGLHRRSFLTSSAKAIALLALPQIKSDRALGADNTLPTKTRDYLRSIAPTAERVTQFTDIMSPSESVRRSNGWTFDGELGWVHCPAVHSNGVDGSKTFYSYEPDGARKLIHFSDRPCRIHAYGDSFTHCDQVSDGETWSEYLAAHLQEPIRNYGVGGFSVYQAYRRMLRTEKGRSAKHIILNIYQDDHFRNLDAWRSIRVGAGSNCGFTLPHLKVNITEDRCQQVENLLPDRQQVGQLRRSEYREETFADDPILRIRTALREGGRIDSKTVSTIAHSFGFPEATLPDIEPRAQIRKIHTEAALFATQKIIQWTEDFVRQNNKNLMIILSFGSGRIKEALSGEALFDQTLLNQLEGKPYPVIDMRTPFAAAYRTYNGDLHTFLRPYYIGHHTPRGNFFTAWSIKEDVVNWLTPKPAPYGDL